MTDDVIEAMVREVASQQMIRVMRVAGLDMDDEFIREWLAEKCVKPAYLAAFPLIRERMARELERKAENSADFVRNNAHIMHPMWGPNEVLGRKLDDAVQTDRKFRRAADTIRGMQP